MKIAWIGTGVMGTHMIRNLIKGGNELVVFNRSNSPRLQELQNEGVKIASSVPEALKDAELICTMLGDPKDVEDVFLREDGILNNAKANSVIIDFTTSSPALALTLHDKAKAMNLTVLDAPVSGGDTGAKNATLSIMVGGDFDAYEKMEATFEMMGTPHYMGKAGLGQHTKACNQIAVAGAVAAMSEAMTYANKVGLDQQTMLEAIRGGAAGSWQLNNTADRVLNNDFNPGFYIKHFIKDMKIVQDEMDARDTKLEMLDIVEQMYESLADKGMEDNGTQSLIKYYLD